MPKRKDKVVAYTDGGSRGNPGPAAAAFVLEDSKGVKLEERAVFLGEMTNNVAEYTAVINALEAARRFGTDEIELFSDSELVVNQLQGTYKVKSDQIRPFFEKAIVLLSQFSKWQVRHVGRSSNKEADRLVNQALNLGSNVETKFSGPRQIEMVKRSVRLGVLISGSGTTLLNIVRVINEGQLNARVAVVISSRSDVAGVERAKSAGLDIRIIRRRDFPDIESFSSQIEAELVSADVDLVVQGGWLCLWKIPSRFKGRVMNIHPALLPSFGGKGMYGHYVHEAVLAAGCKISGCTVHFCTDEYDNGPIIVQRCCEVKENDTPQSLAARVFEQECIAYPQAIRLFAEGKLTVGDNKVKILN